AWVKGLSAAGLAPRTVRMCYQILKSILDAAAASRLIAESACKRIVLPRVPNRENLYLTPEEVERLAAVVDPHFQALVSTAVYLGCRCGELVGLKRDRLDLLRRQVRIVGTLEEIHGVPEYVEETKSSASRRMLTIPAFLVEILAAHLQQGPGGACQHHHDPEHLRAPVASLGAQLDEAMDRAFHEAR